MELVDGDSLASHLNGGVPVAIDTAASVIRQIAATLDHAHSKGVIHRDVKPGNIRIGRDGVAMMIDFGIAQVVDSLHSTATGVKLGTFSYMSPEQIRGETLDGSSDQFSLAVLGYRMLTGRMPFVGKDEAVWANILHAEPKNPTEAGPSLPRRVNAVLLKALNKSKVSRFKTCGEFADALGAALLNREPALDRDATRRTSSPLAGPRRNWAEKFAVIWLSLVGLGYAAYEGKSLLTTLSRRAELTTAPLPNSHSLAPPSNVGDMPVKAEDYIPSRGHRGVAVPPSKRQRPDPKPQERKSSPLATTASARASLSTPQVFPKNRVQPDRRASASTLSPNAQARLAKQASGVAPPAVDPPLQPKLINDAPVRTVPGGGIGYDLGAGFGPGSGGGVAGPGMGGGVGGGVFRVGDGVSAPSVLFRVDPEYSEEARKAKYSGTVLLGITVDTEGHARDIHVVKSLGMGLDEKAMEAVAKWKFRPGMKNGLAVNVRAQIEINFRFL